MDLGSSRRDCGKRIHPGRLDTDPVGTDFDHAMAWNPVLNLLDRREDGKGEVTMLVMTDISNIYWFMAVMFTSIIGLVVITYLKLPVWKLQLAVVLFLDVIGALLLISRLHTL